MSAATRSIDTPQDGNEGHVVPGLPVEAATKVYVGTMAALNATGNIVPASDAAGLRVLGRCEGCTESVGESLQGQDAINSQGAAGALQVNVRRGIFRWNNSQGDPVSKADVENSAYVEDDNTVNSSGGAHQLVAGKIVDVDEEGVWIDTR